MITTEDIAEVVKVMWGQNTILVGLVPGGIIFGREPDTTVQTQSPYATFEVKDNAVAKNAGFAYVQTFGVMISTWDETGAAATGPIKQQIETTLGPWNGVSGLQPGSQVMTQSGRIIRFLQSNKQPGGLEEDKDTQRGQAVKIAKDSYDFFCQG